MKFAKKSLGQNFLIDKNIINKILNLIQIKNKNIDLPAGAIGQGEQEFTVRTEGKIEKRKDLEEIPIKNLSSGITLRLKDISNIFWVFIRIREDSRDITNASNISIFNKFFYPFPLRVMAHHKSLFNDNFIFFS